jgi:Family of unknown function (DUF6627)
MRIFPRSLRFWTALVVLGWTCTLQTAPAFAGLVASQPSGQTTIASARDADVVTVQRALENKLVAQKLRDYGVNPDEAKLKVASLSDQDLHTLATASKGLPTGGDDGLGVIITILVIVLLVIVIMKLMNKEIVVR